MTYCILKNPKISLFFQEIGTAEGLGVALESVTMAEVQISSSVWQPQYHSFSSFTLTMPQNQLLIQLVMYFTVKVAFW